MVKNFLDALELDAARLPRAITPLALAAQRIAGRYRRAGESDSNSV